MTIKDKFPKSFELYRDYIKSQIRTLDTVGMPDEFITTLVTDNIVEIAIKK